MKTQIQFMLVVIIVFGVALVGCTSTESTTSTASSQPMTDIATTTGFLSTYSNLEPAGENSLRYLEASNRLARYDKFVIYPVELLTYEDSEGNQISVADRKMLQQYMHDALVKALSQGDGYEVVDAPAWDVADVRVALTDVKKSALLFNAIPRLKLIDLGLGGMSMEAEIIDSVSNVQIAAAVESKTGRNLWIDFSQFDDAKGAMDEWAYRFRRIIDEAHGR